MAKHRLSGLLCLLIYVLLCSELQTIGSCKGNDHPHPDTEQKVERGREVGAGVWA